MKAILSFIVFTFLATSACFSQTAVSKENVLTYYPQIPAENTYKIVSNTTGKEIPTTILEYINYHRMAGVDVTWKPIPQIELLIYPIGFIYSTELEHETH